MISAHFLFLTGVFRGYCSPSLFNRLLGGLLLPRLLLDCCHCDHLSSSQAHPIFMNLCIAWTSALIMQNKQYATEMRLTWLCAVWKSETRMTATELAFWKKIRTHKRFKTMVFIRTKRNKYIFGVIHFIKLQNDTYKTAIKQWKQRKMRWRAKPLICFWLSCAAFVSNIAQPKTGKWFSSPLYFSFFTI